MQLFNIVVELLNENIWYRPILCASTSVVRCEHSFLIGLQSVVCLCKLRVILYFFIVNSFDAVSVSRSLL